MFVDKNLLVSNEQSLAGVSSTTALSDYSIDLSASGKDYFKGKQVYAIITCDLGVTTATSVQFQVVTSTAAGGTTGEKVLADSGAIVIASLTIGCTPIVLPVPPLISGVTQRYLMIKYTTVGTPGVGKFSACFGFDAQTNL